MRKCLYTDGVACIEPKQTCYNSASFYLAQRYLCLSLSLSLYLSFSLFDLSVCPCGLSCVVHDLFVVGWLFGSGGFCSRVLTSYFIYSIYIYIDYVIIVGVILFFPLLFVFSCSLLIVCCWLRFYKYLLLYRYIYVHT